MTWQCHGHCFGCGGILGCGQCPLPLPLPLCKVQGSWEDQKKPFVCRVASQTDLQRSGNIMLGSWRQRMIYRPHRSELPVVFLKILSSICVTLRSVKIFNKWMPQQVGVSTLFRPWCCRPSGVRSAKKSCGREIQGNAASQCSHERRTLGTFALLALLALLHFQEPVVTSDGQTYERQNIQERAVKLALPLFVQETCILGLHFNLPSYKIDFEIGTQLC